MQRGACWGQCWPSVCVVASHAAQTLPDASRGSICGNGHQEPAALLLQPLQPIYCITASLGFTPCEPSHTNRMVSYACVALCCRAGEAVPAHRPPQLEALPMAPPRGDSSTAPAPKRAQAHLLHEPQDGEAGSGPPAAVWQPNSGAECCCSVRGLQCSAAGAVLCGRLA